jgi:hypothetical protein
MKRLNESGQTLIALLIFMLVAMTITIAAIAVSITNIKSNISLTTGEVALQNANSGIEDALIRVQRDPSYSGGTLTLPGGNATISISGSGMLNIVSVGSSGNFRRTITVTATLTNDTLQVSNWSETP